MYTSLFKIIRIKLSLNTVLSYCLFLFSILSPIKYWAQDFCGQTQLMEMWFKQHPEKKAEFELLQSKKVNQQQSAIVAKTQSAPSYTIPVVFHILHLGGAENISDAQVIDQVAILNRDYQKKNADTAVIVPSFTNNIANVGFEFKLATIDPDGNCTNGIVRHYTSKTNWDANDLNQFIYTWPADKYLNFYVVKSINISATAYTFLPGIGIPPSADAIVCLHQTCGSIGTANVSNSRTLTHEVGHWFSLPHIWGVSNAPGVACGDDGVFDTPITKGFSTCNTANSAVCTAGIAENVQNYMDYSPCKIMFTNGQAANMIATINSSVNDRDNISTIPNLIATGVYSQTLACSTLADFYSTKTSNCAGNTFTFTSLSQFGSSPGTLNWNFPGGTPSTSSNSSVVVSYATPGTYTVSLTATSGNGTDTETKIDYVNVFNGSNGLLLPYQEDFEGATLSSNMTIINEQLDTVLWKHNTLLGANGTNHCLYINNFPDSTNYGNRDFVETPYFNFTNTSGVTLSYYYAYAKRYVTQADSFKVQYSLDCGGSWVNISGVPTINVMAANSGGTVTSVFIPTSTQWKLVNIPAGLLNILSNKPSVKFRFFFKSDYYVNGSNNIYIDQININGNVVTSLTEFENQMNLNVYPNPSTSSINIEFVSPLKGTVKLQLNDITGRCLKQEVYYVNEGELFTNTINERNEYSAGIYLMTLDMNGQKITKKLIVE